MARTTCDPLPLLRLLLVWELWGALLYGGRVVVPFDVSRDPEAFHALVMRLLADIQAPSNEEISIRTVFSMPTLEALAGEIERRIYEKIATMSEFEAEQLAQSNPVAEA